MCNLPIHHYLKYIPHKFRFLHWLGWPLYRHYIFITCNKTAGLSFMEFIYLAVTVLTRKKISEERVTIECLQLFIEKKNRNFINSGSVIR